MVVDEDDDDDDEDDEDELRLVASNRSIFKQVTPPPLEPLPPPMPILVGLFSVISLSNNLPLSFN